MRRRLQRWKVGLVLALCALSAQGQAKKARPQVVRPDGAVWAVIQENCISCHGIDDYAYYAEDKAGWAKVVQSKHQGMQVELKDSDKELLMTYLAEKFGPSTKPFPRAYVPSEITEFFSDPEAYRLVNRACTKCHASDRIDRARNVEERWRAIVLDMRERGAEIADKEVEQLVEWLGRVRGTNQGK
jgi:hypothetical protein